MSFANVNMDPILEAAKAYELAKGDAERARALYARAVAVEAGTPLNYRKAFHVTFDIKAMSTSNSVWTDSKDADAVCALLASRLNEDVVGMFLKTVVDLETIAEEKRVVFLRLTMQGVIDG